jgi:leader peptidase (prepilin peptidase)/N-methyltransferase
LSRTSKNLFKNLNFQLLLMNIFLFTIESVLGLPEFVGYIFVFLLGAIIGSFLNVVIHRVPNEESIIFPNSACPNCKNSIKFYDNIPILSWLMLGAKCRSCKNPIAWRYPAVELLNALLFVLVYWQIGLNPFLAVALIFVSVIVSLVFIDAEHMILPDVINFPLLFFALIARIVYAVSFGREYFPDFAFYPLNQMENLPAWLVSLIGAVLGGLVGGGSLWFVGWLWKKLRGVDAMGLGDVKMMFAVGAILGWRLTLLSIFLGAFSGAVIGVFILARQKNKDLQTQIPFGIFLGIGSILSLLFGEHMIKWYFDTFVPK